MYFCKKPLLIDFGFVKPEAVGHHRNTAKGHGQGGQYGMQLPQHVWQVFKRVENTGSNWDQNDIVAKGPES